MDTTSASVLRRLQSDEREVTWERFVELHAPLSYYSTLRAGYDNAFMESCFGAVKTELELVEYADSLEAVRELSD